MQCTLCYADSYFYCEDRVRSFFRCSNCDLIFADPGSQISAEQEKKLYDLHENDPNDFGYRRFLAQLSEPLLTKLQPAMKGLDYGCGPGPTLNLLLEEKGMSVSLYDIYYFPQRDKLNDCYDFVTSTEVVEHFAQPSESWSELARLVKPGGYLGIMTALFTKASCDDFQGWGYKGDPTHISFYTPKTMHWLACELGFQVEIVSQRVIIFKKL